MWLYPGPSCPDHPSSEELSSVEVDSRIHMFLDLRVYLNPRAGPAPMERGVASNRVIMLGPILVTFAVLSFHYASDLVQGLGGIHGEPRDAA
jgi:hypothetical protein